MDEEKNDWKCGCDRENGNDNMHRQQTEDGNDDNHFFVFVFIIASSMTVNREENINK